MKTRLNSTSGRGWDRTDWSGRAAGRFDRPSRPAARSRRLIRLRRNFGQTAAMSAGFHEARGATMITLDADLQNDPADIPRLMAKVDEGKILRQVTIDDLQKNPDGSILHPSYDLHWGLVELVMEGPRELYSRKIHRAGIGKPGNNSRSQMRFRFHRRYDLVRERRSGLRALMASAILSHHETIHTRLIAH